MTYKGWYAMKPQPNNKPTNQRFLGPIRPKRDYKMVNESSKS